MNVTNSIIKFVASLAQKKNRDKEGCFACEGTKCVRDTWEYFNCRLIVATQAWYERYGHSGHLGKIYFATNQQMQRMSQFSTTAEVIAVYDIPHVALDVAQMKHSLNILLDEVQDPGNLGTIIRIADWYGIRNIFCSKGTVDVFNHKVIQATMGAISRVKVHYCDLVQLIEDYRDMPLFGTFLNGENIYSKQLPSTGFVVFGNEGRGICSELSAMITNRLLIPSGCDGETSESLNVGMAAAITISEFQREKLKTK